MPDAIDYNRCPFCQGNIEPDFKVCPLCGARIIKTCEGCGKDVRVQWTLCPYCGRHVFGPEHYLETAQKRLESGNYTEALRYVLYARGLFPKNEELRGLQEKIQLEVREYDYKTLVAQAQEYEKAGYLHAAIDAYSRAQAIKADDSISQRIEFLRSRLEEENKKRQIDLAKSYEEKARACEKEGKLRKAIGLYENAYATYESARIQKKIDELKERLQKKRKRYTFIALGIGATSILITVTLIILFVVVGIGKEKSHETKQNVAEIERDSESIPLDITTPTVGQQVAGLHLEVAGKTLPKAEVSIQPTGAAEVNCRADYDGNFSTIIALPDVTGRIQIRFVATKDKSKAEKYISIERIEEIKSNIATDYPSNRPMPPLPEYISYEEQMAKPYATGPVWRVTASPETLTKGNGCRLEAQWNRFGPSPGNELWFLVKTPSGKIFGRLVEIVGGTWDNPQFSGIYNVYFPNDFNGASTSEAGTYSVYFVNYSTEYDVVHNYSCAEFRVK